MVLFKFKATTVSSIGVTRTEFFLRTTRNKSRKLCLLSFRHLSERRFLLSVLFWMKIFCSGWPYLIRNHLSFLFSVLFSNIYSKIKFTAKNWSDLCNFYSKVIFWSFCLRKYFLLFFAEFKLLMFHNKIVKISDKLNKRNLLKICLKVTYPTDFCKIRIHFYYRKKWKYLIF